MPTASRAEPSCRVRAVYALCAGSILIRPLSCLPPSYPTAPDLQRSPPDLSLSVCLPVCLSASVLSVCMSVLSLARRVLGRVCY